MTGVAACSPPPTAAVLPAAKVAVSGRTSKFEGDEILASIMLIVTTVAWPVAGVQGREMFVMKQVARLTRGVTTMMGRR